MDQVTHTQAPCLPTGGSPAGAALRWVEECLGKGAEVRTVRPLPGGRAHTNHALLVESGSGSTHELVLRRWTASQEPGPGHLRHSATAAFSPEREIAALALLAGCEIPTPALVAADPAGAYCDVPALLITLLPGHPPHPSSGDLPEYLIQLAAALLPLHTLNGASTMPPYVPHNRLDVRLPPRHALRPELWERAHDIAARPAPEAPARFIHRDYHADNTLWCYGRLTGVVDWSDASSGPIAVDIARMRRGLALRYGPPVADRFLSTFDQVSGGYPHDPYWDVRVLLDLLPEAETGIMDEAHVPLYENYLAHLIAQC